MINTNEDNMDLESAYNKLSRPFDTIAEREGAGGKTYRYIPITEIIKRINDVFGLRWGFEILREELHFDQEKLEITRRISKDAVDGEITASQRNIDERITHEAKQKPKSITTLCRITIRDENGIAYSKEAWGSQEVKYRTDNSLLNIGNDKKGATSDALKKCAELMGVALELDALCNGPQRKDIIKLMKMLKAPEIPTDESLIGYSFLDAENLISQLMETLEARQSK